MTKKKLDIIIPVYKARDTLFRCLSSIGMQTGIDKVKVYLVNDSCPTGSYASIIKPFQGFIDIEEIILPENSGPGYARQYGIDHSTSPYLMFVDADDTLTNSFVVDALLQAFVRNPNLVLVTSDFYIEQECGDLLPSTDNHIPLYGKVYSRQFLQKYNITFPNLYMNEDFGFQSLAMLYINGLQLHTMHFNDITYIYHYNDKSLTREDVAGQTNLYSTENWLNSIIPIIQQGYKDKLPNTTEFVHTCILELYAMYNYILPYEESRLQKYNQLLYRFRDEILSKYQIVLNDDMLSQIYLLMQSKNKTIESTYQISPIGTLPCIDFYSFLKLMMEGSEDGR